MEARAKQSLKETIDKMQLLENRLLVKLDDAEEKTAGGIILPDTVKEKPRVGTVLKVGAGYTDAEMTVDVGDKVIFGKYGGNEIDLLNDDTIIMLRETDLFAYIPKERVDVKPIDIGSDYKE